MQETKLIKTIEQNNAEEPMTFQRKAMALINGEFSKDFDVTDFCEKHGIYIYDIRSVSRLCQIGNELPEVWSYFETSMPEVMESLKNPEVLYQQAVMYLKEHSFGGSR